MLNCIHCYFPLTGTFATKQLTEDSVEHRMVCSYCNAILRIEFTTLRSPDPKRLAKGLNKVKGPFVHCEKCNQSIQAGKSHLCQAQEVSKK